MKKIVMTTVRTLHDDSYEQWLEDMKRTPDNLKAFDLKELKDKGICTRHHIFPDGSQVSTVTKIVNCDNNGKEE